MNVFIGIVINFKENQPLTSARAVLESHSMAFAAKESQLNEKVIDMKDFRIKKE